MLATMARWGAMLGGFGGRDDRDGGILGLLVMTLVAPIAALVWAAVEQINETQPAPALEGES